MRSDRESEADVHPRRIELDGRVDEVGDTGELDDAFELGGDLAPSHAEDRSAQINVFAPGQLGMKPRANFDQRGQAALDRDRAGGPPGPPPPPLSNRALA